MKLTWRSHSACRIEAGAANILIDPFLSLGRRSSFWTLRGQRAGAGAGLVNLVASMGTFGQTSFN
jgi:L-ascorbate metabolism protein UlaG (beta-lactamase superfamily)